jgi:hypothetical protein
MDHDAASAAAATTATPAITDELVDDIAAKLLCHPHTVIRRLVGLPIRSRATERVVDQELASRGLRVATPRSA